MPAPYITIPALCVLSLLALLFFLPIRVVVTLKNSLRVRLKLLVFSWRLYPPSEKQKNLIKNSLRRVFRMFVPEKKKGQRPPKKEAHSKHRNAPKGRDEAPPSLGENVALLRTLLDALLSHTKRHLRLRAARLHVTVATGDAAETALLFGTVSGTLSFVLDALDGVTRLRATVPDVSVMADFEGERSRADVRILFSITPWGALLTLFALLRARSAQSAKRQEK